MAKGPSYRVTFRRRREGKTDYQQRQGLVASGLPRIVIRGSLRNISIQLIKAEMIGDRVIVSAHSNELAKKYGWQGGGGSLPAAYLTGFLCGYKGAANGVKEGILDLGLHAPSKGSRIFSALKGILDSGITVPHEEKKIPSEERIRGAHVTDYAKKLSTSQDVYRKQFSEQLSRGLSPEGLTENFLEAKQKISSAFQKAEVSEKREEVKKTPESKPKTKRAPRKEEAGAKKTVKPRVKKSSTAKKSVKENE